MTQHTPGPWHVENLTMIRDDATGRWLATAAPDFRFPSDISWESQKTNAQLIAAAPDLLDAAKAQIGAHSHENFCDEPDPAAAMRESQHLADKITLDAIAKATQ